MKMGNIHVQKVSKGGVYEEGSSRVEDGVVETFVGYRGNMCVSRIVCKGEAGEWYRHVCVEEVLVEVNGKFVMDVVAVDYIGFIRVCGDMNCDTVRPIAEGQGIITMSDKEMMSVGRKEDLDFFASVEVDLVEFALQVNGEVFGQQSAIDRFQVLLVNDCMGGGTLKELPEPLEVLCHRLFQVITVLMG